MLVRDHAGGVIEVKAVRLEHPAADVLAVDEILDARALVERASPEKSAEHRVDRERPVAASAQGLRQAARYPPAGDARDEELEATERAR